MTKQKLYYFTSYDSCGDSVAPDHFGSFAKACKVAKSIANLLGKDIYINCGEDIVDVEAPDDDESTNEE